MIFYRLVCEQAVFQSPIGNEQYHVFAQVLLVSMDEQAMTRYPVREMIRVFAAKNIASYMYAIGWDCLFMQTT